MLNGDHSRCAIWHQHRNQKRADTPGSFCIICDDGILQRFSPPIADETKTPILPVFASVISSPELASASLAAATPNCSTRSRRRASFGSIYFSGTKPFTSAAICTFNGDESNSVIGATPEIPLIAFFQLSSTVNPRGLTVPIPVITTRSIQSSRFQIGFHCTKPQIPL